MPVSARRPAVLELRRDSAHHLELASEVVRAEELLLDAALCGDPDFAGGARCPP